MDLLENKSDIAPFLQLYKKTMGDLKVACVGIITQYEAKYATIQPILKERYVDSNESVKMPLLNNILCLGDEPEIGDLCLVVFCDKKHLLKNYSFDKDIPFDNFLIESKKREKRHNLNNGIAICGFNNCFSSYQKKFIIKNFDVLHDLIIENGGVEIEN